MDLFRYIVRFLYKIRWYLVILPMIALIVAWFMTRNMDRIYDTNTTIYTGMITGYNLEGSGAVGGNSQTNITNLMLIITTDNTIHEVALRLFGRCMMYGNPNKDNNYISAEHFRQLNGKVFTPFQDREILTLALHTPTKILTQEQAGLISMLRADFDIDEHYTLGAEPQLPPPTDLHFQTTDYVLLGYYKDNTHLLWILKNNLYNVRAGKDPGSIDLSPSVCGARYILLYGKEGYYKCSLKPNSVRVWSKEELAKSGYGTPRHDFYLMFFIDGQITKGDFAKMDFDKDKLKELLNKYGKDNANHDKGAVAVPFSELVACKK